MSNGVGKLEAKIIAELGGIHSPYMDEWFARGTETDIEHILAASEAHRNSIVLRGPRGRVEVPMAKPDTG